MTRYATLKHADTISDIVTADPPITEMLIFMRGHDGTLFSNVPHVVTHHSPAGYSWGYNGSGPADLALNICEQVLRQMGYEGPRTRCWDGDCFLAAWQMHQEVKQVYIATLPSEGGIISYSEIADWIEDWLAVEDASAEE